MAGPRGGRLPPHYARFDGVKRSRQSETSLFLRTETALPELTDPLRSGELIAELLPSAIGVKTTCESIAVDSKLAGESEELRSVVCAASEYPVGEVVVAPRFFRAD
jgi:hypothetical protein